MSSSSVEMAMSFLSITVDESRASARERLSVSSRVSVSFSLLDRDLLALAKSALVRLRFSIWMMRSWCSDSYFFLRRPDSALNLVSSSMMVRCSSSTLRPPSLRMLSSSSSFSLSLRSKSALSWLSAEMEESSLPWRSRWVSRESASSPSAWSRSLLIWMRMEESSWTERERSLFWDSDSCSVSMSLECSRVSWSIWPAGH